MRRGMAIVVLLLAILGGVAIGVGAYHAGVTHGLAQSATGGQVVRVIGPGYGWGFFPFGIFLFPLFFFLIFGLLRVALFGGRWNGYGPGGWDKAQDHGGGTGRFEDWHRRQHEQPANQAPSAPDQT